jgi:hypothetical protein
VCTNLCNEMMAVVSLALHGASHGSNGKREADHRVVREVFVRGKEVD